MYNEFQRWNSGNKCRNWNSMRFDLREFKKRNCDSLRVYLHVIIRNSYKNIAYAEFQRWNSGNECRNWNWLRFEFRKFGKRN